MIINWHDEIKKIDPDIKFRANGGWLKTIEELDKSVTNGYSLVGDFAILEEENHCGFYVGCVDCGCHSVIIDFFKEEDRLMAAERTAKLWNSGKVIKSEPGE